MDCPLCGGEVGFYPVTFLDGSTREAYGCKSCCVVTDPFLSVEEDAELQRRFAAECAMVKYFRENPPEFVSPAYEVPGWEDSNP